mmetsp:Transcript_15587/g.31289  ORF Transcript_15587/g.31289 Transcript_15587/m.31289 type:complete len:329 (+) Transcript_15587:337-1323(+)
MEAPPPHAASLSHHAPQGKLDGLRTMSAGITKMYDGRRRVQEIRHAIAQRPRGHPCLHALCRITHCARWYSRLGRSHHAVFHQAVCEGAVHHLEAPRVADHLPPEVRPPHHWPRIPHPHPYRLAPRGEGLGRPVVGDDRLQLAGPLHDAPVFFDRDEVWVRPLAIEVVEGLALSRGELRRLLTLTPRSDNDAPSRLEHARHLLHVLDLVGHVLARLTRPHEIEAVVLILHVKRVADLELRIRHVTLRGECRRSLLLLGRDRDPRHRRFRKLFSNVAASAADAAADVKHLCWRVRLREVEHLVDEVVLGLDEVLAAVEWTASLLLAVVA